MEAALAVPENLEVFGGLHCWDEATDHGENSTQDCRWAPPPVLCKGLGHLFCAEDSTSASLNVGILIHVVVVELVGSCLLGLLHAVGCYKVGMRTKQERLYLSWCAVLLLLLWKAGTNGTI